MYADLALDNHILKDVIEKKTIEPKIKKELAGDITEEYEVSIARAAKMMNIHRSYFNYSIRKDDSEVEAAIKEVPKYGEEFWKILRSFVNIICGTIRKYIGFIRLCIMRNTLS